MAFTYRGFPAEQVFHGLALPPGELFPTPTPTPPTVWRGGVRWEGGIMRRPESRVASRSAAPAPHLQDDRMGTLFIPNTLATPRNDPNPEGARKLVDFLLSPEVEKRLAESESAQIPLNPQVKMKLPPQIEVGRTAKRMDADFDKAADLWDEVQEFVRKEFM